MCGGWRGFEGWREIIACWCMCVCGGGLLRCASVCVVVGVGGVMSLPAGESVLGAHLDLDWLCEEGAERPAHVYA